MMRDQPIEPGNTKREIGMLTQGNLAAVLRENQRIMDRHGTLSLRGLENGLFPAAGTADTEREYTNYHLVWVRDNVHIAHQMAAVGEIAASVRTMTTLCWYFTRYRHRFVDIIEARADPAEAMNRPHVRFAGETLSELDQPWNHKQNDALGYFLWFFSKLVAEGWLRPNEEQLSTMALFPQFFAGIAYWQDEDNGHWEEWPKTEASSVGVVVAALRELKSLAVLPEFGKALARRGVSVEFLDELIEPGQRALTQLLPWECIQPEENKRRDVDSALLFLIYPVAVVGADEADRILENVRAELEGEIGIARYKYDSFWCADYKKLTAKLERTGAVVGGDKRSKLAVKRGEEAQWCIFDSIVSCIHAQRYLSSGREDHLDLQLLYLNRSLRQLTYEDSLFGAYQCPEAYYLDDGQWVPNDSTPLRWAQANLRLALHFAEKSAAKRAEP